MESIFVVHSSISLAKVVKAFVLISDTNGSTVNVKPCAWFKCFALRDACTLCIISGLPIVLNLIFFCLLQYRFNTCLSLRGCLLYWMLYLPYYLWGSLYFSTFWLSVLFVVILLLLYCRFFYLRCWPWMLVLQGVNCVYPLHLFLRNVDSFWPC